MNSEDELPCESRYALMDKVGFVEGALSELTHEHQLSVTVCSFVDSFCFSLQLRALKFCKFEFYILPKAFVFILYKFELS